jgi:hypothetical protein
MENVMQEMLRNEINNEFGVKLHVKWICFTFNVRESISSFSSFCVSAKFARSR